MSTASFGWLLGALCAVVACKSHGTSERDTKERASALESDDPPRDVTAVETGHVPVAWKGTIRESTGKAPPVGAECTLTTDVWSNSNDTFSHDQLRVVCGGRTLYDDTAKHKGHSTSDYTLNEFPAPGEVSAFTYELTAHDVGTRTGDRNQITVATADDELIVFREIAPTFRVKVELADARTVRRGKPMFEDAIPAFNVVVKRTATLQSSRGTLPFTGKTCELRISPGIGKHNCRIQLECNAMIVFGAGQTGLEVCSMVDGRPVSFADTDPTSKDADPELTVNLTTAAAVLGDDLPNGTSYSATFALRSP